MVLGSPRLGRAVSPPSPGNDSRYRFVISNSPRTTGDEILEEVSGWAHCFTSPISFGMDRATNMASFTVEKVDFRAVKKRGNTDEQSRVAKRMFAVVQPLFCHLVDREYKYYENFLANDTAAVAFRGFYLVDASGRDHGLVAMRVEEAEHNG